MSTLHTNVSESLGLVYMDPLELQVKRPQHLSPLQHPTPFTSEQKISLKHRELNLVQFPDFSVPTIPQ